MANPAAEPKPVEDVQGDGRWMSLHNAFIADSKEREPEVLFIGDSILSQLQQTKMWSEMFEPLHCLNFSIGGDQTQHVLWRVQNGELDTIYPKVIVLLVGTNNHDHTPEQVVGGVLEIVATLTNKQPQAQLLVVGLLPRGEKPNKLREKFTIINKSLDNQLADLPNATFLLLDPAVFYVAGSEEISRQDMWDYLHLTSRGYQKLCEPILEEVQSLLQNFVKVENTSVETASMAGALASDQ